MFYNSLQHNIEDFWRPPQIRMQTGTTFVFFFSSHLSFYFCSLSEFPDNCCYPAGGRFLRQCSDIRRGDGTDEGSAAFHTQTLCLTQNNEHNPDMTIYATHRLISGQARPGSLPAVLHTALFNCKMVSRGFTSLEISTYIFTQARSFDFTRIQLYCVV